MYKPTCLKNSPRGDAILEQYDLFVARSGSVSTLTAGESRLFSAVACFNPSVFVLRRSETARARWAGFTLLISEHILTRCVCKIQQPI